jgi:outer membrane lipoprotein-sorting protein
LTAAFRCLIWTVGSVSAFAADQDIFERFVQASRLQRTVQRNEPVEVEITATILQSRRQSQLRAVRHVSDQGEVAYDVLQASGDDAVRRQVIVRYLTAESQSRETDATAVTPLNYKFRLRAIVDQLGRKVGVFQLTPRKKKTGLFKGELWVDEITGMPVRESGQ